MKVSVRFFARCREIVGEERKEIEIEDGRDMLLEDIITHLINEYPDLKREKLLISRNHKYAKPEERLEDMDEIAIFPPVSGG
ncbi:MAG: MoaD/ThiS family protein [Methanophagales archaeon]|nr:MoaD/ThiS family protein [Methanophagales archaeon]